MRTLSVTDWRFTLADERDAWAKGYDDAEWRVVTVPHDWAVEQEFAQTHSSGTGYLPGGIGWYRAHVSLALLGDIAGKHGRVVFHGVYKNADVWVNGYHLGRRPSGHAEFGFELTEILSYAPDDDLVISVRVDHTEISDSRWYNGAGITRRVEVIVDEPVRRAPHGTELVTESADARSAAVTIRQALVNDRTEPVSVRVRHELRSLATDRVHVVETVVDLAAESAHETVTPLTVDEPELWSDEAPNLYRLTTTLSWTDADGAHETQDALITGIRVFSFDPDRGFFVNGAPRTLKGVCLHEDAGPFGVAVPADVWLRRLLTLQEAGTNAIRMAHNSHEPELYALCDALGLYVIDEAFDEWENPKNKWWQGHNVYPPRHQGYATYFPEWHERDLVAMIDAHRHHPSIIAWSIGNEIDYPNDPYASPLFEEMTGNNDANKPAQERRYDPSRPDIRRLSTIAARLADIVEEADPTRPVTLAAAFPELSSRTGLLDRLGLVGYNYKEHLYADDHERFPEKPFIGSENGHGYAQWRAVADNEYISGQFLWTGIDYLGEAHGWPIHGSAAGLMTLAGYPKHLWHLRRSWWSDEPTAHLATRPVSDSGSGLFRRHPVSRTWDAASPEQLEVIAIAAGGEPVLRVDGDELALAFDDENGYWRAEVSPSTEVLELEVRAGEDVVARDRIAATGPAVGLSAEIWRAPERAANRTRAIGLDPAEVVQIECALRDADGTVVTDDVLVTVEVDGADLIGTELIGLENGDLGDVTAYASNARRTFEGRLIVFVRAAGAAAVRLSPAGLPEVTVELA